MCSYRTTWQKKMVKDISYVGRVAGNMFPLTAIPLIMGAEMLAKRVKYLKRYYGS